MGNKMNRTKELESVMTILTMVLWRGAFLLISSMHFAAKLLTVHSP